MNLNCYTNFVQVFRGLRHNPFNVFLNYFFGYNLSLFGNPNNISLRQNVKVFIKVL